MPPISQLLSDLFGAGEDHGLLVLNGHRARCGVHDVGQWAQSGTAFEVKEPRRARQHATYTAFEADEDGENPVTVDQTGGKNKPGGGKHAGGKQATKLPDKKENSAGTNPPPDDKGIICGVATGDGHSDGRITCGIPMFREHQSGAPFILPLYMQPNESGGGGGGGGGSASGAADVMSAKISGELRQEALLLLKRFLDSAPDNAPAAGGGGGLYYPVPDKKTPQGIAIVSTGVQVPLPPDLGPALPDFGAMPPQTGGIGTFI